MSASIGIEELLGQALHLSREQRAYLAEKLLQSLDHGEPFEISPAWREEIRRRCREIDEGRVALLPAEQVFAEVDDTLG